MNDWGANWADVAPMFSNRLLLGCRMAPWATLSVGPTLHWVLPAQVQNDAWREVAAGAAGEDAPAWWPGLAFYLGL